GITRAIEAGKRLKRFVGTAEPVPFVTPPAMPKVLKQEFVVGMKEYGLDHRVQSMGLDVLSQAASMQERLPEIREEHEGPVKATWTSTQSGQQASGSSPPRMTSQGPAANSMSSNGSQPVRADIHSDNKKATGLPTLPASSSALWEVDFPGYTPALLTILLTWSHAMQSFYRRLPDPKTFPIHAAFPRRITPPAYNRLISVGFYYTSFIPHKDIRFLGPGDMAEIGYAEVDVFRSKEEVRKRTLGVYRDQIHLADSGEGRWAYVLIKEHAIPEEETPPHVMLAWHLSAVTDTSTCLHTVFPDNHEPILSKPPATPAPPEQPIRRLASLQNLISPSRGQKHLHREIRSVSSSAGSTEVEESSILPQEGAQTLKRTVVKLEKAGSIPLIKGYRVDLKEFRGWLDA
ncbi:hypothetical protein CC77DRAFT_922390, partial [Alternaria alternata]